MCRGNPSPQSCNTVHTSPSLSSTWLGRRFCLNGKLVTERSVEGSYFLHCVSNPDMFLCSGLDGVLGHKLKISQFSLVVLVLSCVFVFEVESLRT